MSDFLLLLVVGGGEGGGGWVVSRIKSSMKMYTNSRDGLPMLSGEALVVCGIMCCIVGCDSCVLPG